MTNYNTLIIDTTRDILVVVATYEGKSAVRVIVESSKRHQPLLLSAIDEVLEELDITLANVKYLSALVGPGSFTGIRIGLSTINAFRLATRKPLVSVNFFELLAYNVSRESLLLIDAGHGNHYVAKCDCNKNLDMGYMTPEELDANTMIKVYYDNSYNYVDELVAVVMTKIAKGEITNEPLRPMYLRESQAEREANAKL